MEEATQNRFNRFLGGFPNRIGAGETHSLTVADWSPEVDISQDNHEYLLKADLPEMKKDGVRVTVEDGILCVSGERKNEKEDQKRKFHRIERAFGNFRRSFTLPEDADSTKVTAEFRDGVLKCTSRQQREQDQKLSKLKWRNALTLTASAWRVPCASLGGWVSLSFVAAAQ
jgi:HSP20 family protein